MNEFTLDINQITEDVNESFKEEEKKAAKPEYKTQAEKNAVAIFETDFEDINQRASILKPIEEFGLTTITRSSNKNNLLNTRMKDLKKGGKNAEEVGDKLALLSRQIKSLDPSGINFEKSGILSKFSNPIKKYFAKYEKAEGIIDDILISLDESNKTLQNDNVTLEFEEKGLRELTKSLMESVELGKQMDASIESQILDAEINGIEQEKIDFVREEVLYPLRQRLMDMQQMIVINQQGILSINVVRRNNKELIRGIKRAENVTLTSLRTGIMLASALYNQRITMNKIKVLNTTTEEIITSTSKILRQQGSEIQKASSETMISPEVLKDAFSEALTAIEEVSTYKQNALSQMKDTINTFNDMAIEGEKIVAKIETGNE